MSKEWRRTANVRRERELGNWGRASEHIGRRWEDLGYERLVAAVKKTNNWPFPNYSVIDLVPLMSDISIQAAIAATRLPSPDVIVVVRDEGGRTLLQALDFKWDLEFATYDQISAAAAAKLLSARPQPLIDAIAAACRAGGSFHIVDGLLFAPDSEVNRRFLSSPANGRRDLPIDLEQVFFEEVDSFLFFSSLPGWDVALRLAQIDRACDSLHSLEAADRYYRLGAGLLGAASKLASSIFETDPPPVLADAAIGEFTGRSAPYSSSVLVEQAERSMALRAQQQERLRKIARCPYRLRDLEQDLVSRGITLPERVAGQPVPAERAHWMQVLKRVEVEYRATVTRAGLRMVQGGDADEEALARLEGDTRPFAVASRKLALTLIEKACLSLKEANRSASV